MLLGLEKWGGGDWCALVCVGVFGVAGEVQHEGPVQKGVVLG
jgi:hypothetical protein